MAYGDGTRPHRITRTRADGTTRTYWRAAIDDGWTPQGTRRRRTVSGATEAECRRNLRNLRREINARQANTVSPRTTVKRWADTWLPVQAETLRPKAYAVTETMVQRWIVPTIGHRRLSELTAADARELDAAHRAAGNTGTTARTCRRTLAKMLRDAQVEGHEVPAAVLAAPMPRAAVNTRTEIPTADAVRLLRAAMSPDDWPPLPADATAAERKARRLAAQVHASRWLAALLQGMRQGECLGLTWDRVDLDAGTVTIDRQMQAVPRRARDAGTVDADWYGAERVTGAYYLVPVKSRAGVRVIPLVPAMVAVLAAWREECPPSPWGLVWPRSSGGPWSSGDDRMAWQGLQDAAGVAKGAGGHYVVHEARHSTATLLMALRVPTQVVIAIMGHASISTTQGYQHADLDEMRTALAGVAGMLQIEG